ncbi:hypothetical protein GCM10018954_018950 [Kutzneria kofuensis]
MDRGGRAHEGAHESPGGWQRALPAGLTGYEVDGQAVGQPYAQFSADPRADLRVRWRKPRVERHIGGNTCDEFPGWPCFGENGGVAPEFVDRVAEYPFVRAKLLDLEPTIRVRIVRQGVLEPD